MMSCDKDVHSVTASALRCISRIRCSCLLLTLISACCTPAAFAVVDLSGNWMQITQEDAVERIDGPEIGDYTGLPINDAARMRAETWAVPEHQCEPHPADYAPHGPGAIRIWSDVDPRTQEVIAWHIVFVYMNSHQVIWMDGRPHPPEEAQHTWMGFSTGKWEGDKLVVETTHLKEGWIRRNGVPRSDLGKLTEYWMRHGNSLTVFSIVEDPVYLTAPLVRSWNWVLSLGFQIGPYPCEYRSDSALPKGFVAHVLPENAHSARDFATESGLPLEAVEGGEETLYPEYMSRLAQLRQAQASGSVLPAEPKKSMPIASAPDRPKASATKESKSSPSSPAKKRARTAKPPLPQESAPPTLRTLHVRDDIWMVSGPGGNAAVQVGNEGIIVIDTQTETGSEGLLAEIRKISDKPIRYVLNTSADLSHVGGNVRIAAAGAYSNAFTSLFPTLPKTARVYAHENVLRTMSDRERGGSGKTPGGLPTDTYFEDALELYLNGQAVRLLYQPAAHSDGDSVVYLRGSDVVSTGEVFSTVSYPVIDIARGGSINGVIAALNRIIDITVPAVNEEGGTLVIPGHGRVCDEYEVVIYRDMVTVIRDRIKAMIANGMSLEAVVAAHPTMDYDGRYGTGDGTWTTREFVASVYQSLAKENGADSRSARGGGRSLRRGCWRCWVWAQAASHLAITRSRRRFCRTSIHASKGMWSFSCTAIPTRCCS
jgi:cyclase